MNLVAHHLLSFNREEWQVGNYLGEVVKGKNFENYPREIITGIKLHRFIDSFTDANDIVKLSTTRLHGSYRKYAPIIIDIFYDYFLIKNWNTYSNEEFETFKQNAYKVFQDYMYLYPPKQQKFTEALIKYDFFEKYGTLEGIELTLTHLSRRTTFNNNMHMAVKDLYVQEDLLDKEFNEFFPQIIAACKLFLKID